MYLDVLVNLFSLENLLFSNVGVACGIIFGAIPGLTATMGVAILLPLTFGLDSVTGMLLLLGVYCGGIYGGSITAILINTPGTPAAAATVLDGYKMAQQGNSGNALEIALVSSVIGGLFSCIALTFIAPVLASFALRFGPAEYFSLALFGLTIISLVSGESLSKGLIMASLGLFVSVIGIDKIEGVPRFTFGVRNLYAGVDIIPAMLGVFAVSEILEKTRTGLRSMEASVKFSRTKIKIKEILSFYRTIVKSCFIGTFIGAVPGTGAAIASFISYSEAKRSSKTPEKFGTGYAEGIIAAETANNAVTGATLIPLLTLGIPGDVVTAILIGALMMQGITPGPHLFTEDKFWVYSIMFGLVLINILMFAQAKVFIKFFSNVTKVSPKVLIPILIIFCTIGAYAVNNSTFDILLMIIFGFFGYFLSRLNFPLPPLVIALVLGPLAEDNMRRAMILSDGNFTIFFTKPISLVFIMISMITIFLPMIRKRFIKKLF